MRFAALVMRSLARARWLLLGVSSLLVAFQLVLVNMAASYEQSQGFSRMAASLPAFLQRALGEMLGLVASFQGVVLTGYFHPIVMLLIAQAAIVVASEPAGEIESSLVDLVMSRPIRRSTLVTRSLVVMAIATLVLVSAMAFGTRAGFALFAPAGARPAVTLVAELTVHLVLVAWCFGAATLALSGWARRRAAALGPVAVAAVFLYLLAFLASSWAPARPYGYLSPFYYYAPLDVMAGTVDRVRDAVVLTSMIAASGAVAYWRFARRDL